MFNTPYSTTSLKDYQIAPILNAINKSLISQRGNDEVDTIIDPDTKERYPSLQIKPMAEHIPAFTQPLLLEKEGDEKRFVVDMRPFTKADRVGELHISSLTDYKLNLYYSILCSTWVHGGHYTLESISAFPARIFTQWLSGIITRNLNLDMVLQVRLKAIIGAYYALLHEDGYDPEDIDLEKTMMPNLLRTVSISAAKASFSNPHSTEELIKDMPVINTLPNLITYLKTVSDRFEPLTLANLYAMVARSWFGANAPTLCAVALEYPPAFNIMVFFALTYRGLNRTGIGTITDDGKTSPEAKQFKLKIEKIIEDSRV